MIIDCPLNAFINKDFITEIINVIDHPISLKAVRDAETTNTPITTSPLTRRTILGFLPLGRMIFTFFIYINTYMLFLIFIC
jgi:hypothetical protein